MWRLCWRDVGIERGGVGAHQRGGGAAEDHELHPVIHQDADKCDRVVVLKLVGHER
jgi:hypothetical protein